MHPEGCGTRRPQRSGVEALERLAAGIRGIGRRILPLIPGSIRAAILRAGPLSALRRWFLAGNVEWWDRYYRELDQAAFERNPRERRKFELTLEAIGPGPFERALEIGSGPGILSGRLAERCQELIAMDLASVAVERAGRRLAAFPGARAVQGRFPDDLPDGPFDLVVVSDTFYYLTPEDQDRGVELVTDRMSNDGIFVVTHHRHDVGMPMSGDEIHSRLRRHSRLALDHAGGDDVHVVERFRRADRADRAVTIAAQPVAVPVVAERDAAAAFGPVEAVPGAIRARDGD